MAKAAAVVDVVTAAAAVVNERRRKPCAPRPSRQRPSRLIGLDCRVPAAYSCCCWDAFVVESGRWIGRVGAAGLLVARSSFRRPPASFPPDKQATILHCCKQFLWLELEEGLLCFRHVSAGETPPPGSL